MTRTPTQSFIRNLWLSFLVYTGATALLYWSVSAAPWGNDEIGAGRGIVVLGSWALWVLGLLMTLVVWSSAKKQQMTRGASLARSAFYWGLALIFLLFAAAGLMPPSSARPSANERNAAAGLMTIATAEADFRANDRDANQVHDFWVADVAALYGLVPVSGGNTLRSIELRIALADEAPLNGSKSAWLKPIGEFGLLAPAAGYRYRAMTHFVDGSGNRVPYDSGDGRNPKYFGFCAFPATSSAGKRTLIINEDNIVFWKKLEGAAVLTFPADPAREGWTRLE